MLLAACASTQSKPVANPPIAGPLTPTVTRDGPVLGIALGGGAARGFAHIGVLKTLQDHGIQADIVTGTSAGSVVGALYAGGMRGSELVAAALKLERRSLTDFITPRRGLIQGAKLQRYVNDLLDDRPIEALPTVFAAVATDLQDGSRIVFTGGNTGMAVRASSSVPGLFLPVTINDRSYVDGGLVSQVPVRVARELGADIVVAVDVSKLPQHNDDLNSALNVIQQSFLIMSQAIANQEIAAADVLIRPDVSDLSLVDFDQKQAAIAAGERAAVAALPTLQALICNGADDPTP